MSENNLNIKIVFFSCLLFVLMFVHIIGIIENSEVKVNTEITAMSAFNG